MNNNNKIRAIGLAALSIAATAAALLAAPGAYLAASDAIRWRVGLPALGQVRLESALRTVHLRGDSLVDARSTLLFGDSHLHGFPTSRLGVRAVNYAIAGETAASLAHRIGQYPSLGRIARVLLLTGRKNLALS